MSKKQSVRHSENDEYYNLSSGIGFFFFTRNFDQMVNSLMNIPDISSLNMPNISVINLIDFSSMAMKLTGHSHIRSNGTRDSKFYPHPDWQKRSPIKDVFCRYGTYYS